jgi:hypothetical protein
MTYPGLGGQQPPPQNAAPAASLVPGVTPGVPPILRVTEIIITPGSVLEGIFTYSSNPPAAGTLTESASVETAGTDAYGNHYLAGHATYAAGFATALDAGYVAFYTGSLAAGWTLTGQLETDSAGDLLLSTGGGELILSAAGNVEISGNLTVDGTLSATLSGQTGTGLPAGSPTGGPNSGSFAGHTHDFDGHTHDL